MSKSNCVDTEWINKLLKEVDYLVHFRNSRKERDCKNVLEWIENVHAHFFDPQFKAITMARFLDKLEHILSHHPYIKEYVISYVKDHEEYKNDILNRSYDLILGANPQNLCLILNGLSVLDIKDMDDDWWDRWFSNSIDKMCNFNEIDTKQSIRSCAGLYKKPPKNWISAWSIQCEIHMDRMYEKPESFSKILNAIGQLKINIPDSLLKKLIKNTRILLTSLSKENDLFLVSKSFAIEEVCEEKRLVSQWFELSYERIKIAKEEELESLCSAFSCIGKLDENVQMEWIQLCINKITNSFESLSIKSIANALYAMALFQLDVLSVQSFLDKCKLAFRKERSKLFNKSMTHIDFRNLMQASYFYLIKQYDLGVKIEDFSDFLNSLKNEKRKEPTDGELLVLTILEELSIHHVESEFWVNEIVDFVDFSIFDSSLPRDNNLVGKEEIFCPDERKQELCADDESSPMPWYVEESLVPRYIIEFDGIYHEVCGMTNRLTQLKTFILQNYGYNLIRIHYKDVKHIRNIIIHELSIFQNRKILPQEKKLNQSERVNIYDEFSLGLLQSENKKGISEATYQRWMLLIKEKFRTIEEARFNQLLLQFSLLVENNGRVRYAFSKFGRTDESFKQYILEQSLSYVEQYSSYEINELLHNLVRLSIKKPNDAWRDKWCEYSIKQMGAYNIYSFETVFHYSRALGMSLNTLWIQEFFKYTKESVSNAELSDLCELIECCVYYQLYFPEDWMQNLSQRLLGLLQSVDNEDVFSLMSAFSIEYIPNREMLLHRWLDKIDSVMNKTEPKLLVEFLHKLAKSDINIPEQRFIGLQNRIIEAFDLLDRQNVILLLYSLALIEINLKHIEPILDACNNYFFKKEKKVILSKSTQHEVKRLILASTYFDVLGYKMHFVIQDEHNLYESFFVEKLSTSNIKNNLEDYLRSTYFPDLKKHIKLCGLLKYIDYLSEENRLIIEVDRRNRYIKSKLMDKILLNSGYSILRLSYEEVKGIGFKYVDNEVQKYKINQNNNRNVKLQNDILQDTNFSVMPGLSKKKA